MFNRSLKLPKSSHNLSPQTDQGGIINSYEKTEANNREGPQAREPSKCLNGWNYGERLARGLLTACTRGSDQDHPQEKEMQKSKTAVPSGCEGKLGVALETPQGRRDLT